MKLRDTILAAPAQTEFPAEAVSIPYTASFGMYYIHNDRLTELKNAYLQADELLLKAKNSGKNRIISMDGRLNNKK